MKLFRHVVTVLALFCFCQSQAADKKLSVCTDNNYWYPFTYVEKGESLGWHIDIVREAAARMGMRAFFTPMTWTQCLKEAAGGFYDAIATASFKDERALEFFYPLDAKDNYSKFRVMQVEYVAVTLKDSGYEFDGNKALLPQPVRVPRGYSLVDELRKEGLVVDDSSRSDELNLRKLLSSKEGSLVVMSDAIERLIVRKEHFRHKVKIHDTPIFSKPYFLPISKTSPLTESDRIALWKKIAEIRDDVVFMEKIAIKY